MKRGLNICVFFGILILITGVSALSGGGTDSNPYKITNCGELQQISNNYYAYYELANDIDCANQDFTPIGECYYDFQPSLIGCDLFYGALDGKSHKITNLHISKEISGGAVALFGAISKDTVIKDLTLENVDISNINHVNAGGSFAAGLVGINFGGTISNCHVSGSVENRIFNGKSAGYAGGITAFNTFFEEEDKIGKIENSNFNGEVYGDNVGGLAGINNGNIYSSYSSGTVTSQGSNGAGGLVGSNRGLISNCYSKSDVNGDYDSGKFGGLVGENYYADDKNLNSGKIINSYSIGNVKETYRGDNYKAFLGGLAGINLPEVNIGGDTGIIENSFSSSSVKCDASSCGFLSTANTGGLLCNYEGISEDAGVVNSYWYDVPEDNAIYCIRYGIDNGCINATINQFKGNVKNNQPFVNWDFTTVWAEVANDYPKLKWEVEEIITPQCSSSGGACEWWPCTGLTEDLGQKDCGILHSCCKLIPFEDTCIGSDGTCRTSCLSTENDIGTKYCGSGKRCCKESNIIPGCTESDQCWLKNSHCTTLCTCETGYSPNESGGCITSTVYTCVDPYICEPSCGTNEELKTGFTCETGICCGEKGVIPCGDGVCDPATETWLTCSTDCPKPCEEYTTQPACEADIVYTKDLGYTPENPIINNNICSKKKTEECTWLINRCGLISSEDPDRINDAVDCAGIEPCKWQPNYQGNCNSGNFITISYTPLEGCEETKDDIKISCAAKLPFFTWLNILLIIGALIVFYVLFKVGKKKGKKRR